MNLRVSVFFGVLWLILAVSWAQGGTDSVCVTPWSKDGMSGWEEKSFQGHTQYRLMKEDNHTWLNAQSQAAASGLFKEIAIDLRNTPWLTWRWRVDEPLRGLPERERAGDDFAARIYVVISGGWFFWQTKALSYVWSGTEESGAAWPNAFTGENAHMVVVKGPLAEVHTWHTESRNVRDDLKRLFGEDINHIDAVAIMTDTDNSGQTASAGFAEVVFSSVALSSPISSCEAE